MSIIFDLHASISAPTLLRARIGEAAKSLLTSSYSHMGRGTSLDHIGFVMAVYKIATGGDLFEPEDYSPSWTKSENPYLTDWLLQFCDEIDLADASTGDIITYAIDENPTFTSAPKLADGEHPATCRVISEPDRVAGPYWARATCESFRSSWSRWEAKAYRVRVPADFTSRLSSDQWLMAGEGETL